MKNVERITRRGGYRVRIYGLNPSGWAVQYVSGMDDSEIEPGYWLVWTPDSKGYVFNFEPDLHMTWDEATAKQISDVLRHNAEIETKVVQIP